MAALVKSGSCTYERMSMGFARNSYMHAGEEERHVPQFCYNTFLSCGEEQKCCVLLKCVTYKVGFSYLFPIYKQTRTIAEAELKQ